MEHTRADLENSLSYYGDSVIGLAQDYPGPEASAALAVVEEELTLKHNDYLVPYAQGFVGHMAGYRDRGAADKGAWLKDLVSIEAGRPSDKP